MNVRLVVFVVLGVLIFTPVLQNAQAFKETNYTIQLEVEFFNHDTTNIDSMIDDFDSGLIEQNIFDVFSPIAVGQFSQDDIIADWNLQIRSVSTFHDFVIVNPDSSTSLVTVETNSKLVIDPVIKEINTSQGANKATLQDQIISDTQRALRDALVSFGIKEFLWDLTFDEGVIRFAEKLP